MPWITITGNAYDHGQTPIPASQEPELWFRPNGPAIGGGVLIGIDVKAEFTPSTGAFSVKLYSDLTDRIKYRPWMRWLASDSTEPELKAYGYAELPFDVIPDTGGAIGDLLEQQFGIGLVYVSADAPNAARRNQLQLDPETGDLYERVVEW